MLQRTTLNTINKKLEENSNWKILDLGCGYTANKNATVVADVQDLSNFYKDKKFIKIYEKKLPFKDKEFDFVITSHVIEHVEDLDFFIKEIERISNQGYIELPSKLGDNLVFENLTDHIWWFDYDDESNNTSQPISNDSDVDGILDVYDTDDGQNYCYEEQSAVGFTLDTDQDGTINSNDCDEDNDGLLLSLTVTQGLFLLC